MEKSVRCNESRKNCSKKIQHLFEESCSFNQETTLCRKSIINNIKKAKHLDYQIEVHYIRVDSVDIAKSRVKERVKNGGHGIPDKKIEKRYLESFLNLKRIFPDCNIIFSMIIQNLLIVSQYINLIQA